MFPCNQTQCNTLQTTAVAIIASLAVKDSRYRIKFKYACVCELWCMEPTKCASERQGEEHQHSTWLPVTKCRPPHWPPLCTPWPQPN